jgi:diguanylate cyclase (GGDEF)-like protein
MQMTESIIAGGAQAKCSNNGSSRRLLSRDRRPRSVNQSLEVALSAALQAADREFGDIVQEVDEISRILRSDKPDKTTLQLAAHPAVWSAVKQAFLDRELRHLALTDDLTNLYNRRGFYAAAKQLLEFAGRNSQGLLLLFCDLDNLKTINDSYGHREGDLALIRTSDALERSFRGSDVLARIGGDEFVVLALESLRQSQEVILRRLAKNLRETNAGESRFQLSLSVGAARFDPKHPLSLGGLMLQADKAMYEDKRKRQQTTQTCPVHEPCD